MKRYVAIWENFLDSDKEKPNLEIYENFIREGYYKHMDSIPYDEIKFLRRTNKDGLIGSIVKWKGEKVKIIE